MAKAHAQYQATVNENCTPALPTSLKITSGSNGFRIMDPFDWTRDKTIYQRWQLWSHKARLALDAMEGDSEKTKISYFHHWINGEGIAQIEGWKNNKILNTSFCPSPIPVLPQTLLHTTADKIEGRATDQSAPVRRMRHRIKQECRLLHLTANHLENPQEWKESV